MMDVPSTLVMLVGGVGAILTMGMVIVLARRAPHR